MFKPVIIIPCFNHSDAFKDFAVGIAELGISTIVIDDGSAPSQSQHLRRICAAYDFKYIHNSKNGGKGRAMQIGFDVAHDMGFTHGLQIDADGQHDLADIKKFFELARENEKSLIVGDPLYDDSAPFARRIGRKITNFWVTVETLNLHMPDAMCGMRVYPLAETCAEMRHLRFYRMGFDIEILVKLYWRGLGIITRPTRVIYPPNGTSNFKMLRDNLYIFLLHTYLCAIMPFGICKRIFNHGKRN
ncbi:MAG: glycosyltransferase family 2 protein [Alphaproteobacteria bacterium]|nr:glycosyltransferase family 2 protein [Alphaproteobacteria bacterium]